MIVSIFKSSTQFVNNVEFHKVVEAIRIGVFQDQKFAPAGVITIMGNRKDLLIFSTLVLIQCDVDTKEELKTLFQKVCEIPNTYCCFVSLDNSRLNILVKTDISERYFRQGFNQVVDVYENLLNMKIANPLQDEYGLCNLTFDPNIYFNQNSIVFKVTSHRKRTGYKEEQIQKLHEEAFEEAIEYTNQYVKLTGKSADVFFGALAKNCFSAGIPLNYTLVFVLNKFKLDNQKKGIIKRVYSKSSRKKVSTKDAVFSIHFNNFFRYKPEVKPEVRVFFETMIYKSIGMGIPFYYTGKSCKKELGILRSRRESIEKYFKDIGLLYICTRKEKDEDKYPKTYYQLNLENLEEVATKLMDDPSYFLKNVIPLLSEKAKVINGYFPK